MEKITLKVKMMGGFECTYKGKEVEFTGAVGTKLVQLFIYLMYAYPAAIPLSSVTESLYEDSDVDTNNSFKALLFRLRTTVAEEFGIPQNECIILKGGMLRLSDHFEVGSDVCDFNRLYDYAKSEKDSEEKQKHLERMCKVYHGELLPMMSTLPWVIFENAVLSDRYVRGVNALCKMFNDNKNYESAHSVYQRAMVYFPFEEDWIVGSIDSLVSLGKYKQAMVEYEKISAIIFDEMGIYPSEKLLDAMRRISAEYSNRENAIGGFTESIGDDKEIGAYYANFPGFVNCYHMLQRIMQRDRIQSSVVMLTLVDENDNLLKDMNDIISAASNLRIAISKTLRRNDMYSRYSKTQIVIFLWNSSKENVPIIIDRLKQNISNSDEEAICNIKYEIIESDLSSFDAKEEQTLNN